MEFYIIIIFLALSAFFSGIEIAYVSANKLKMELLKKHKSFTGQLLAQVTHSPSKFLGTTLIGNNISLIVLSMMMANVLEPLIQLYISDSELTILLVQTIITTILVLFLGEFIPKALFRIYPDALLKWFSIPLAIFYYLLTFCFGSNQSN